MSVRVQRLDIIQIILIKCPLLRGDLRTRSRIILEIDDKPVGEYTLWGVAYTHTHTHTHTHADMYGQVDNVMPSRPMGSAAAEVGL